MKNIKTLGIGFGLVLIAILVFFEIGAAIIPETMTAGDSLNDSNRCVDVGCEYNASETTPCRVDAANASLGACTSRIQSIPLSSLFGGSGITFILIAVAMLIGVLGIAFKRK